MCNCGCIALKDPWVSENIPEDPPSSECNIKCNARKRRPLLHTTLCDTLETTTSLQAKSPRRLVFLVSGHRLANSSTPDDAWVTQASHQAFVGITASASLFCAEPEPAPAVIPRAEARVTDRRQINTYDIEPVKKGGCGITEESHLPSRARACPLRHSIHLFVTGRSH